MENEREIMAEMAQLKADYQELRSELEKQQIVNENKLVHIVGRKAGDIRKVKFTEIMCAALAFTCCPSFHYGFGADWWFVYATAALMAISAIVSFVLYGRVDTGHLFTKSLLEYSQSIKRFRRNMINWERIGYVLMTIWVSVLGYQIWIHNSEEQAVLYLTLAIMILAAITGAIIGYRLFRKVMDTCDDIISQIEE